MTGVVTLVTGAASGIGLACSRRLVEGGRVVCADLSPEMPGLTGEMGAAMGLAVDWGDHGIRVNVVGPGVIDTPMNAESLADPERAAYYARRAALGRYGRPAEIASVVDFLTSDDASYMTGAYVPVDGEWLAGERPR